jgi:hypothetical protein
LEAFDIKGLLVLDKGADSFAVDLVEFGNDTGAYLSMFEPESNFFTGSKDQLI